MRSASIGRDKDLHPIKCLKAQVFVALRPYERDAFTPDFTERASTLAHWTAFRKKLPGAESPERLSDVVPFLFEFLLPIVRPRASTNAGNRAGRGRKPSARAAPGTDLNDVVDAIEELHAASNKVTEKCSAELNTIHRV